MPIVLTATAFVFCDMAECFACFEALPGRAGAWRVHPILERLFGEERRRTKIIPHAFCEPPVLKANYTAVICAAEAGADYCCVSSLLPRQLCQ
jgi:hypothetical protein